mmetsp:Transcript_28792/g.62175  ORF Transcript_28792/g.62175 Transcript_28792/m.62175 type:complete len:350 (-) Transcript_28792:80-1129(-)
MEAEQPAKVRRVREDPQPNASDSGAATEESQQRNAAPPGSSATATNAGPNASSPRRQGANNGPQQPPQHGPQHLSQHPMFPSQMHRMEHPSGGPMPGAVTGKCHRCGCLFQIIPDLDCPPGSQTLAQCSMCGAENVATVSNGPIAPFTSPYGHSFDRSKPGYPIFPDPRERMFMARPDFPHMMRPYPGYDHPSMYAVDSRAMHSDLSMPMPPYAELAMPMGHHPGGGGPYMGYPNFENLWPFLPQRAKPRRKKRLWSEEEHEKFLDGLKTCGRGNWRGISDLIKTRTPVQVASHAQKYFLRLAKSSEPGQEGQPEAIQAGQAEDAPKEENKSEGNKSEESPKAPQTEAE